MAAGALIPITADNGYTSVNYNGQLQMTTVLTTLFATEVVLADPASVTPDEGKRLVLTVTNLDPDATAPLFS